MNKLCPLKKYSHCYEAECQLWDDGQCAFLSIAKVLSIYILNVDKEKK